MEFGPRVKKHNAKLHCCRNAISLTNKIIICLSFKLLGSENVKGMEAVEMWPVFLRTQLICCYDHCLESSDVLFFILCTYLLHVSSDSSVW